MGNAVQLEFVDLTRSLPRPPGAGQVVNGFFVYNTTAQTVGQVAYSLECTSEHVYHLVDEGAFPDATDIASDNAARACWRIPRENLLAFIKSRKTGVGR